MKIIIAGASGFVGRELIPLLSAHELVLVGRTEGKLTYSDKTLAIHNYDGLKILWQGADIFVNLAVENNNSHGSEQSFYNVNTDFAVMLYNIGSELGVKRFINASSVLALDESNQSIYAQSKRRMTKLMLDLSGKPETVYLGQVHGRHFSGRLGVLNRLPTFLARPIFYAFAALKPTTHVGAFAQYILGAITPGTIPINSSEFAVIDSKVRNWYFCVVKRIVDFAFVAAVVGLLWWLLILIWIAIRLQSDGRPIFRQMRLGLNEVPFVCYKFRTMKVGTAVLGTHEIATSAVTKFGRFLRRTKLDELPQIINIMKNEMTLVGPRPCLPNQTELIETRRAHKIFSLLPGITGLSQTNGIDMSNPKLLARWDAKYLATQGLILDLKLIVRTALGYK